MTSMPLGLQSFVDSIAPADAITYVPCSNTISAIWSVQKKLLANWSQLTASGIDVVGIGSDIIHNTEDVQVDHLTAAQRTQLEQEFGPALITVQESAPSTPIDGLTMFQPRGVDDALVTGTSIVVGIGLFACLLGVLVLIRRRHHQHHATTTK
jgi:hypothetical protein